MIRISISRSLVRGAAACCCFFFALVFTAISTGGGPTRTFAAQASPQRVKIAGGEYVIHESENGGAVGPFGEEVYNFHESFTLWRAENGDYRVEGTRNFESPRYESHSNPFAAELARDLTLIRVQEFAKLRWVADSGPLSCNFMPAELDCSSGGSEPKREIRTHTPLEKPYGLFWPTSPFSFSSIARQVERDPRKPTVVDFVRIEQPGMAEPVRVTVLEGPLQYLGESEMETAGRKWRAHKFSLKIAATPELLIWTSPKGLLLGIAVQHEHLEWREEGLRLDRFEGPAEF